MREIVDRRSAARFRLIARLGTVVKVGDSIRWSGRTARVNDLVVGVRRDDVVVAQALPATLARARDRRCRGRTGHQEATSADHRG